MEIKTNTLILTFNTPKIPESLKVCYLNIPVSQFVPNPLRCYRCRKFGHVTSKCKHIETCTRCSERAQDARKLVIRMNLARRLLNVLIVENVVLHIIKKYSVYKKEYDIQSINAGAAKAPIQSSSVCTQTDVSWVGPQPVTRRQRPAAPPTSGPLPSVSRSVGTTTRVVDVKKPVVATKSSPPKKDTKSNKPSSPKVSPVHESDAYFTVKTLIKRKVRGVHLLPVSKSPQLNLKLLF